VAAERLNPQVAFHAVRNLAREIDALAEELSQVPAEIANSE
jgi:hypothetical protein